MIVFHLSTTDTVLIVTPTPPPKTGFGSVTKMIWLFKDSSVEGECVKLLVDPLLDGVCLLKLTIIREERSLVMSCHALRTRCFACNICPRNKHRPPGREDDPLFGIVTAQSRRYRPLSIEPIFLLCCSNCCASCLIPCLMQHAQSPNRRFRSLLFLVFFERLKALQKFSLYFN